MSDPNITLVIIAILNLITAIFAWRTHKSQSENASVIIALEKNTNSIKDALVAKTGEAAFAAGENKARIQGEEKAAALLKGDK